MASCFSCFDFFKCCFSKPAARPTRSPSTTDSSRGQRARSTRASSTTDSSRGQRVRSTRASSTTDSSRVHRSRSTISSSSTASSRGQRARSTRASSTTDSSRVHRSRSTRSPSTTASPRDQRARSTTVQNPKEPSNFNPNHIYGPNPDIHSTEFLPPSSAVEQVKKLVLPVSGEPGISAEFLPDIYEAPFDPFSTLNDGELLSFISHLSNLSKDQHGIEFFVDSYMIQLILSCMRSTQNNNNNKYVLDFYHNLQLELFSCSNSVESHVLDIVSAIQAPDFKGIIVATGYLAHSTKLYIGKFNNSFFAIYIDLGPGYDTFGKKISTEKVCFYKYPITVCISSLKFKDFLKTILSQRNKPSRDAIGAISRALNSISKKPLHYIRDLEIRFQQNSYCSLESLMAAKTIHAYYNGIVNPREFVFNSVISPIYTLARDSAIYKQLDIKSMINSGKGFEKSVYIYDIDKDYLRAVMFQPMEYIFYQDGTHQFCYFNSFDGNQFIHKIEPGSIMAFSKEKNQNGFTQKNLYDAVLDHANATMVDQERLYGSTEPGTVGVKEQVIRIEVDIEFAKQKMSLSKPGDFVFFSEPRRGVTTLFVNEKREGGSDSSIIEYTFKHVEGKYQPMYSSGPTKVYHGRRHILETFEREGKILIPLNDSTESEA